MSGDSLVRIKSKKSSELDIGGFKTYFPVRFFWLKFQFSQGHIFLDSNVRTKPDASDSAQSKP